jgi:hypothetical protein
VAKALLENQRSQLRQRVLHHLEVAYGIDRHSRPFGSTEVLSD